MKKYSLGLLAILAIAFVYISIGKKKPVKQEKAAVKSTPAIPQKISSQDFTDNSEATPFESSPEAKPASIQFKSSNPAALKAKQDFDRSIKEGYGLIKPISEKEIAESLQLQSAALATQSPIENHNQLSLLAKIEPFDKERYKTDEDYRKKYLSIAEPARVYQLDQNAKYKLERHSPYFQQVEQGSSVAITVVGESSMPISITSLDLGKFGNGLTYQTIEADRNGGSHF